MSWFFMFFLHLRHSQAKISREKCSQSRDFTCPLCRISGRSCVFGDLAQVHFQAAVITSAGGSKPVAQAHLKTPINRGFA